jgi:hypothetical protein
MNLCRLSLRLLCYNSHARSCSTLFRVAKRVSCHVLVIRMPRMMDSCAVSRGLCFTHGNPALQPSYFTVVNTVSPAHALLRS